MNMFISFTVPVVPSIYVSLHAMHNTLGLLVEHDVAELGYLFITTAYPRFSPGSIILTTLALAVVLTYGTNLSAWTASVAGKSFVL